MPVDTTINDLQKVTVTLTPDGSVDGIPTWTVVSGLATIVPAADGMSASLVSEDNVSGPGPFDTVYEVSADVDMGAGVQPLTDTVTLHVVNNQATTLGLSFSPPENK